MSTIKDVAKRANVSIATVSNYLNGTNPVSSGKKLLIEQAMKELDYMPNISAKSLKSGQSKLINIVLPSLSDPYYVQFFEGAEDRLRKKGYDVNISVTHENPELELEILKKFKSRQGAGLIIASCQTEENDFLTKLKTPIVQLERHFTESAGFISCDYKKSVKELTEKFLCDKKNFVSIIAGPEGYFNEDEAVKGFTEACDFAKYSLNDTSIIRGITTKQSAFFSFLEVYKNDIPDVIIVTSQSAAEGIKEGLRFIGKKFPEETIVVAFGVNSWSEMDSCDGVYYVKRPATEIGVRAAKMLESLMNGNEAEKQTIPLATESVFERWLPAVSKHSPKRTLRLVLPDFPQMHTFAAMLPQFENENNCKVELSFCPLESYLKKLLFDKLKGDVFVIDRSWLLNLVEKGLLADVSNYILANPEITGRFLVGSLNSMCYAKGRYYGIPLTCMPQIMYYRNDFFTNPMICRMYEQKRNWRLRPPKTWADYNNIAKYFTREFNPESPTKYGTSFAAAFNSCFLSEFYVRLNGLNGCIYDKEFNVRLNSKECRAVFEMLLETVKCCPPDFFETDNSKAMNDFLQGETAMIISYRTPQIESSILKNNIGTKRIGFARVPGGCSILGGWSISLSATSEIKDLGFKFMDWACSESISPYVALLTGQSAIADIYNNEELMIMNPWMPTLKQITETAKPIVPPNSFMLETIPQDKISEILYSSFKDIVLGKCDIDIALEKGEETLKNIFIKYGYKQN